MSKTVILSVLYVNDSWSLRPGKAHRLSESEKRVLMRTFGTKREGVTGNWREMHNKEPKT
jgi:hypothetical protein